MNAFNEWLGSQSKVVVFDSNGDVFFNCIEIQTALHKISTRIVNGDVPEDMLPITIVDDNG